MNEKKMTALQKISVAFTSLLYLMYLYYENLITFSFNIVGDTFGFVTKVTCIASFFLTLAVFMTEKSDRAFKIAFIGSAALFVINPMLGITLSVIMSMYAGAHIFDISRQTKKEKMRLFIASWFISVTFVQWAGSFCVQRFYLAEFYSNLHYVAVFVLCLIMTAPFVILYLLFPKLNDKIKGIVYKAFSIWFLVALSADIFGVWYAMTLKQLELQISVTLAALAITIYKTARAAKKALF